MFSRIYKGTVIHHRRLPHKHRFSYRLFMMYLDLNELPTLFDRFRFWALEKLTLATFRRSDHYGDQQVSLQVAIKQLVKEQTGKQLNGPVTLLTHLRYFGYVMNPVSFYFCWNSDRTEVEAVVAEVHNTPWGEQHCYVLHDVISPGHFRRFDFDKTFHVSPFMGMKQHYSWFFNCPGDRIHISMQSFEDEQHMFTANMRLQSETITQQTLNRTLIQFPFMTLKVIGAIYWQAFCLWLKQTPFFEHPKHFTKQEAEL